jgi:hypothetical protein
LAGFGWLALGFGIAAMSFIAQLLLAILPPAASSGAELSQPSCAPSFHIGA